MFLHLKTTPFESWLLAPRRKRLCAFPLGLFRGKPIGHLDLDPCRSAGPGGLGSLILFPVLRGMLRLLALLTITQYAIENLRERA